MDTQNVSAQLYFKQLPPEAGENSYNCTNVPEGLSTCVDPVSSDKQIEDAFQEQLNLSEYYKSPRVFDAVKRQYMDPVMENENVPKYEFLRATPEPPPVPTKIPVGPTDFLRRFLKEGFGSDNNWLTTIIMIILGLIIISSLLSSSINISFQLQNIL
jgi:hypothetical protein